MESTKFSLLVNRGDELKTNADLRAEHRAFFAANLERRMRELKMSQSDLARAVWQETRLTKAEIGSLTQDCVSVNYSYVGVRDGLIYTGEGLWTLEVPDHALGRAVKRSRLLTPETIIREAHRNVLGAPLKGARRNGYIKAGAGCFAVELIGGKDVSGRAAVPYPRQHLASRRHARPRPDSNIL